ncbi:MAG: branched-chain amino acid ABC transporter permease [Candidatus Rokubacteria bacterium 13_1_40CM_69_27]|nr:MAG: branched-chain amino acid ABC transporter permease [Candidatus Rokubacteria bacterium 13_1_40CM_69_27]OLC30225.1 MAG: branched-chain amino acid ABC transporter permease [Candidatus Rokubacteria bacterium 13_1_40CM_4_69_5]OLE39674.1 MAG: branched-chain amino acid ABC transporter permease [Candidatus Rokubacteria bacterium 13_1_20CM_2_70_7]
MPSLNLLGQALLAGLFTGGLYALLGLGLSLTWGLLRVINLANFALAFLGAYLSYQLATALRLDPFLTLAIVVPAFFVLGVVLQLGFQRFGISELVSLIVTFGLTVILESLIQWIWTADFRRLETPYVRATLKVGTLYVGVSGLLGFVAAAGLTLGTWAWLRWSYLGKAARALAEDGAMAAAFGVDRRRLALLLSGLSAAYAAVAGLFIALSHTLAPSQIYAWMGVVFAAVIIGRLGNALGLLAAAIAIAASEALTMAVTSPGWAPLVSFTLLIVVLLLRPEL